MKGCVSAGELAAGFWPRDSPVHHYADHQQTIVSHKCIVALDLVGLFKD